MNNILYATLILHGLMWLGCFVGMLLRHTPHTIAHLLWMLLLPVFGPVSGFILCAATGREPSDGDWLSKQSEAHYQRLKLKPITDNPVPLEEALLVNDPAERRKQMMNLLQSDPMENLDLLMLARFNEDVETAHYATATITELQRKIQLQLQRYQIDCQAHPDDAEMLSEYIHLLNRYCASGLLNGQVLRRQRFTLENALNRALALQPTPELVELSVINYLALQQSDKALSAAHKALALWPRDERSWLIQLRVHVEMHDGKALKALLASLETADVDWSVAGRERLRFWTEKQV